MRKDPILDSSAERVAHLLESVAQDSARSVLLTVCEWLEDEATVTEIAAELLRGTPSTDITEAKDGARKVTAQVVSALRRRVGWEL
jgi:hypothetical protein